MWRSACLMTGMARIRIGRWLFIYPPLVSGGNAGDPSMGIEVTGIFGLLLLILVIYAVVKTVQSTASTGAKVLWVVILLLLPLVGFIFWLLLGPKG